MDNSLRGRLLRMLEKVKTFREKKVEVEPEPQEDKKPSELPVFCMLHETEIGNFNMYIYLEEEVPIQFK